MSSVENTNMSKISMEELIAISEYFSGNIPSDEDQFEKDVEAFNSTRSLRKSPL